METKVLDTSIWQAILSAGLVVQLVLVILILMSLWSWTLILAKWQQLKVIKKANLDFLSKMGKRNAEALSLEAEDLSQQVPLARVYLDGYHRFRELVGKSDLVSVLELTEKDMLRRIRVELGFMESYLSVLASTGSVAPFIGLFGTVWGIFNSFQKIGAMGSASLAVVAPGISEALVATAIGLFAAIPASLFYNQFVTQIRAIERDMNEALTDFLFLFKQEPSN